MTNKTNNQNTTPQINLAKLGSWTNLTAERKENLELGRDVELLPGQQGVTIARYITHNVNRQGILIHRTLNEQLEPTNLPENLAKLLTIIGQKILAEQPGTHKGTTFTFDGKQVSQIRIYGTKERSDIKDAAKPVCDSVGANGNMGSVTVGYIIAPKTGSRRGRGSQPSVSFDTVAAIDTSVFDVEAFDVDSLVPLVVSAYQNQP